MLIDKIDKIEIVVGDITHQSVDAIVNAANNSLMGGGGVDGAIHEAAGPELTEDCRKLHGCATGEAKITQGYHLAATWVIHTVGPIWRGGTHDENVLLASCYRNSLTLAAQHGIRTIAFPSISTGAYGFPIEKAARIALTETIAFLKNTTTIDKVIFVCFSQTDFEIYRRLLQAILKNPF